MPRERPLAGVLHISARREAISRGAAYQCQERGHYHGCCRSGERPLAGVLQISVTREAISRGAADQCARREAISRGAADLCHESGH